MPEDFGVIAMIGVLMALSNSLVDSGLASSLIRSKDVGDNDYSTVFYFNLLVSIFLYLIIYVSSGLIADFFDLRILVKVTKVLCLVIVINALGQIHRTRFVKELKFDTLFKINLPSSIISGVVGILLAFYGYGVWSLVYMTVIKSTLITIQFWIYAKWFPLFTFSKSSFSRHFGFGVKLGFSSILNVLFQQLYTIIIGKYYSAVSLGLYNRANSLKQMPVNNFSSILKKVSYPLLAKMEGDVVRIKKATRKLTIVSVAIVTPILVLMGTLAEPLFSFLFTDKWLAAVPYFQILCISGILYPIHNFNLTVLNVLGRSDLFLKLEVIKKVMVIIAVVVCVPFGVEGLLWGAAVTSILALIVNSWYSNQLINYSIPSLFMDIAPYLLLGGLVVLTTSLLDKFTNNYLHLDIIRLTIGSTVGIIIYVSSVYLLKLSAFTEIKMVLTKNKI